MSDLVDSFLRRLIEAACEKETTHPEFQTTLCIFWGGQTRCSKSKVAFVATPGMLDPSEIIKSAVSQLSKSRVGHARAQDF